MDSADRVIPPENVTVNKPCEDCPEGKDIPKTIRETDNPTAAIFLTEMQRIHRVLNEIAQLQVAVNLLIGVGVVAAIYIMTRKVPSVTD